MSADLTHAQANDLLRRAGLMRDEIRETPSAVRIALARRLAALESRLAEVERERDEARARIPELEAALRPCAAPRLRLPRGGAA